MDTLLHLAAVSKYYAAEDGAKITALNQLELTISAEHHLISLIGPDGSGKSTMLKILAGILAPDSGTYYLNLSDSEQLIGYMSQSLGLYEDLSVADNLLLFSKLRDIDINALTASTATTATSNANVSTIEGSAESSAESKEAKLQAYLDDLLQKVGLLQFKDRKAGSLSGGMKQKLALTCAISAKPRLLLLDEPTVGVDPMSRRELWQIIFDYIKETGSYCLFSSLYLEEAEHGSITIFIKQGQIIYQGSVTTLKEQVKQRCLTLKLKSAYSYQGFVRKLLCNLDELSSVIDICPRLGCIDFLMKDSASGSELEAALRSDLNALTSKLKLGITAQDYEISVREPILEDAYISLTYEAPHHHAEDNAAHVVEDRDGVVSKVEAETTNYHSDSNVVIDVHGIRKQFGNFTAVHDSSFQVYKGEIFGLLGPNGAGKTTTFRMICALLNPSAGSILINGMSLAKAKSSMRAEIGYVAQKFCLYRKLTLLQNLNYFGRSYGLTGKLLQSRISEMCETFNLTPFLHENSGSLPFGIQRSLSMACALIHRPKILFLDEATSGADPTSRRSFWRMIATLAGQGTTIIVTTHFMEEAEYCDRFLIQDQGKILILGTPDEICMPKTAETTSTEAWTEAGAGADQGRISIEEAFIRCVEQGRQK